MVVLQTRLTALCILAMSLLDAVFTLNVLTLGAREANPLMAHLIDMGVGWFFAGKLALTLGGVVLLILASQAPSHRGPSALTLLRLCFFCYAALMAWHLFLVGRLS